MERDARDRHVGRPVQLTEQALQRGSDPLLAEVGFRLLLKALGESLVGVKHLAERLVDDRQRPRERPAGDQRRAKRLHRLEPRDDRAALVRGDARQERPFFQPLDRGEIGSDGVGPSRLARPSAPIPTATDEQRRDGIANRAPSHRDRLQRCEFKWGVAGRVEAPSGEAPLRLGG